MAAADDAGVGQGVKVSAGLLDRPLKAFGVPGGVAQRAVDPDLIDGGAELPGQLRVDGGGLRQRVLLV